MTVGTFQQLEQRYYPEIRLESLRPFVYKVEAFSKDSIQKKVPIVVPEIGVRWGKQSDFTSELQKWKQWWQTGGFVLNPYMRNPGLDRTEDEITSWSPVHVVFELHKLFDPEHEEWVEVKIPIEFTVLKSTRTQRYIDRTIYGWNADGKLIGIHHIWKERTVNLYLRFMLPSQRSHLIRGQFQRYIFEGDMPMTGYTS